jgi:SAM-dependent methyltransferase
VARALPGLIGAYRTGAGVDADVFGDDWRDGHAGANRALYANQLAGWLPLHLSDLHRRLLGERPRIADIGCGAGWASIALATAYPRALVTAVDCDARVVPQARRRVAEAGLADRVTCLAADVTNWHSTDRYDLVCVFDAMHELARPVEALQACRGLVAGDGAVLVLDAQVPDVFGGPGDEIERFQYATSVLHCLPAGLVGDGAVGTGTVMRGPTMREYAHAAGFAEVRSVDLNDRFHRLYQLTG